MRVKTIGNKITLTCVVLVTFTVALAAAALIGIGALSADIQRLQVDSIPGQYSIGRLEAFATTAALRMNGELLDLVTNSGNDAEHAKRLLRELVQVPGRTEGLRADHHAGRGPAAL